MGVSTQMPCPLSILSISSDKINRMHTRQSPLEETTEALMIRFKSRLVMTLRTISRIVTDARLRSQGMTRTLTIRTWQMKEAMVSSDARREVQLS
jgi:hypothetical protein